MKLIKTGQHRSDAKRQWDVMVDDADFILLSQFRWQVNGQGCVSGWVGAKDYRKTLLHRFLLNPKENEEIDHVDGNRLNNQRCNLRLATSTQNKQNRGPRKDNKIGLKGVSWNKERKFFRAQIKPPLGKSLYLGQFTNPTEAARAYNEAAKKYHGEFAFLNVI